MLSAMLLVAAGTYYFSHAPHRTLVSNGKTFDIAVMIPTSHPAIDLITAAFIDSVHAQTPANITVFNGNRNRALIKAQAEEILDRTCDLVMTVGAGTSLIMKEARARRASSMPQVFTAVDEDPVKIGLVDSLTHPSRAITGVQVVQDHKKKLDMLMYLKPSIKRVLLVYDPTQGAGLAADRDRLATLCAERGLTFSEFVVTSAQDIYTRASAPIAAADVVTVLIDNTVVSALETLVALCNKHGVLLYVSDLDSVDKGAALGFGIHEADSGRYAAQAAVRILLDKKEASSVPIMQLSEFYLKVNPDAMVKQRFVLEPHVRFLLTHTLPPKNGSGCYGSD